MTRFKLLAAVFLLWTAEGWSTQPSPIKTPEQIFNRWLSAFNRGNQQELQEVIAAYKIDRNAQRDADLHASMGNFNVLTVRSSSPKKVEMIVQVKPSERALLVTVELEQTDPSDVHVFQIEGVEMPSEYRPKRVQIPTLAKVTKQRLDALVAADTLSGALLVAKDGKVLLQWQGGMANRSAALAVTPETQFRLASLNKMFTAVAVLQLVDAGKLSLDGTINDYLPDYPDHAIACSITLRQLLNHTSGLGEIFGDEFSSYSQTLKTHADYIKRFGATPPEQVPGSQDGYSNYGYVVLGAIIEAVSGQSYYDYVDQHIYRVAGMGSTGSEPESKSVASRALGYAKQGGAWQVETASLPWRGTAAGGGYSTVGDMLKFGEALRTGKLLSPALLEAATSPQNHKHWYGYGFMVSGQGEERQYGHEGGAPGANTAFVVLPSNGYVVVGLSNTDPDAMENVVNYIARRLPL
ncbi:serine hydrolase domain-containing protein [Xanthomonas hortorum]|uniref:serine hydrolase domain-containing protein n=1 Tax=Xanthomonas hortorum TaxID=56454 RepID=UPI0029368CDB|nr:serine hydrolase domain-containing protein [Xanthomonas hortorum]MDV2453651.1 serine hydrolase domain-containing protein [Xanthomonas hortorum NBC5720]